MSDSNNEYYQNIIDYHAHNGYYRGSGEIWSIREGWSKIRAKKIHGLGIANKVEFNHPNHDWIPIMRKKIDIFNRSNEKSRVLLGIELDIGDPLGKTVFSKNYSKYLDYVIAGPHNQPVNTLLWSDLEEDELEEYFNSYRDILVNSFKNPENPISIWAHPFLQEIQITASKYWDYLKKIYLDMLEICEENNIAIEINENYFRKNEMPNEMKDFFTNEDYFIKQKDLVLQNMFNMALKRKSIQFSFASDSHNLTEVGNFPKSLEFAKKIHIPQERLLFLD